MDHALIPVASKAALPEKYSAAKLAIKEADSVDECKSWADKSAALGSYARQSQDKDLERMAMRIRARAIQRCGELLREIKEAQPGPKKIGVPGYPYLSPRKQAAEEAGLSLIQAKNAIRVSNVPKDSFELQVESENPPSIKALAEQGKKPLNRIPIFEQLGMTKKAFQAGMYFRGDMERYIKAMGLYDPQDVVDGSTPEERETIKRNLKLIAEYHGELLAKL